MHDLQVKQGQGYVPSRESSPEVKASFNAESANATIERAMALPDPENSTLETTDDHITAI